MDKALIVVDVQESFRQRPSWRTFNNPDIVERVNRLVDFTRSDGGSVIWLLHTEPETGTVFDPVNGYVRLMDGLKPAEDEPVMSKASANAFTTTRLQQYLTSHGIGEIVICGIRTEQCCETTARVGADLGFDAIFVSDATATNPIEHRDAKPGRSVEEILADPRTLTADQVVERTEYALHGRFARISSVAELTGA
jgi:nicotinamidase-related amidase